MLAYAPLKRDVKHNGLSFVSDGFELNSVSITESTAGERIRDGPIDPNVHFTWYRGDPILRVRRPCVCFRPLATTVAARIMGSLPLFGKGAKGCEFCLG